MLPATLRALLLMVLPASVVATPISSPSLTRTMMMQRRQQQPDFGNDTQNGLLEGSECAPVTVIFARGTRESGNVGTFAGPPFFRALAQRVGTAGLVVQGVDYAAVPEGFFGGGDAEGSKTMANLVLQAQQKCPNTKVIMSGYSQGGQLVHNAAKILGPQAIGTVAAAVTFGDPYNPAPIPGIPAANTRIICHNGDDICVGGSEVLDPHFTYGQDAGSAADFIVSLMKAAKPGPRR